MNKLKHLLVLLVFILSFNSFSQSGTYVREPKQNDGSILKWTLNLNDDGTFLYHFYRNLAGKLNPEEHYYGKGTWKKEGKLILFFSKKEDDLNEEYTVNLNNSKARYITKSPRDKSDKIVKTALRFYDSETFHVPGLIVFKE